jgi:hypothetical protein
MGVGGMTYRIADGSRGVYARWKWLVDELFLEQRHRNCNAGTATASRGGAENAEAEVRALDEWRRGSAELLALRTAAQDAPECFNVRHTDNSRQH